MISNETIRDCVVAHDMSYLAPYAAKDLVRVGKASDGGYVLPEWLAKECDFLGSFGLNDDWSFEEELRRLNPTAIIHGYDHSISEKEFALRLAKSVVNVSLGKVRPHAVGDGINTIRSYRQFYQGTAQHFRQRIYNRLDSPFDVTLKDVLERTNARKALLKIDIEGCEYRIIDDVIRSADILLGLVVEFHDTGPLRQVFLESVRKLQGPFGIVHVHANNHEGVAADGLPEALEITFVLKTRIRTQEKRLFLPLDGIDWPNNPNVPEYGLRFVS
jgi:FkbM family methyltransferase